MNPRAIRRAAIGLVATAAIALGLSAPAYSARATVQRIPDCGIDPGDIPGLAVSFEIPGQVVVTPDGALTVQCHGSLPAGFAVAQTFQGDVLCVGDPGQVTSGHIVATTGGRVSLVCHFPAP